MITAMITPVFRTVISTIDLYNVLERLPFHAHPAREDPPRNHPRNVRVDFARGITLRTRPIVLFTGREKYSGNMVAAFDPCSDIVFLLSQNFQLSQCLSVPGLPLLFAPTKG